MLGGGQPKEEEHIVNLSKVRTFRDVKRNTSFSGNKSSIGGDIKMSQFLKQEAYN